MDIGNQFVATPMDHPWAYNPAWRHEVAKLTVDMGKITYAGPHDPYIQEHIHYLHAVLKNAGQHAKMVNKRTADNGRLPFHSAFTLYQDNDLSTAAVEALLLCPELSLLQIAGFMGKDVTPATIKTFERLYFNIRDENGAVLEAPWLRQFFASSNQVRINPNDHRTHWRLLAFEGGYKRLFSVWHWPLPDGEDPEVLQSAALTNNVFSDLESRSRFGTLGNRDLVELFGNLRQASTTLRDRGLLGGAGGSKTLLLEILGSIRPHPEQVTAESLLEKRVDLQRKLEVVGNLTSAATDGSVIEQTQIMISKAVSRRAQGRPALDVPAEPVEVFDSV